MPKVLRLIDGIPRVVDSTYSYEAEITVGSGGIAANTPITLPNSQTYTDKDLVVRLNGITLVRTGDFNTVGSVPRTQISFSYDLVEGDIIQFRIE